MKRIIAVFLVIMMLGSLTACSNKEETGDSGTDETTKAEKVELETFTWDGLESFNVSLEAPKDKGYEFVEGRAETAPYENYPAFTFVGEKFLIEFTINSYVYNTSTAWKEKHGETEANFEDFKKDLEEDINHATGTIEQVNGEDVVQRYDSRDNKYVGIARYYNTDGLREDGWNQEFLAIIYALDESIDDIDNLLEDEEVKAIYDSIRLEGK